MRDLRDVRNVLLVTRRVGKKYFIALALKEEDEKIFTVWLHTFQSSTSVYNITTGFNIDGSFFFAYGNVNYQLLMYVTRTLFKSVFKKSTCMH